jgi:hypothetical protein
MFKAINPIRKRTEKDELGRIYETYSKIEDEAYKEVKKNIVDKVG